MSNLVLANEGVFPICFDAKGNRLKIAPKTGFDFPGTFQGEGKLMGIPSLFIRFAGCNLRCAWSLPGGEVSICDTPNASFNTEKNILSNTAEVVQLVSKNLGNLSHVVITGGEPFLQPVALAALCKTLKEQFRLHITVETNGTIFNENCVPYIDLFSISPKLSDSNPTKEKMHNLAWDIPFEPVAYNQKRRNIAVIQQFVDVCKKSRDKDFQLKFVVSSEGDEAEIKNEFLKMLHGVASVDVIAMPLGSNSLQLQLTAQKAIEIAIRNNWRYSPRVHIDFFGENEGV